MPSTHLRNKDIRSLTGIRGVAALYVAIHHSLLDDSKYLNTLVQNFASKGYLSVDLFFSLSGFVMMLSSSKYFVGTVSPRNYITFMQKRFARVYPVYFVAITIGFFILKPYPVGSYIAGIPLLSVIFDPHCVFGITWSLSAEWIIYLIFPFFCLLINTVFINRNRLIILPLVAISLLVLFRFNLSILNLTYSPFYGIQPVIRCFANYLLGIYSYKMVANGSAKLFKSNLLANISSALLIGLLFIKGTNDVVVLLFPIVIGFLYTGKGAANKILSSKIAYFLGLVSYTVYLIHVVFLIFKKPFFKYIDNVVTSGVAKILLFNIFYLTILILVAYILYRLIEVPAQRFLKKKFRIKTVFAPNTEPLLTAEVTQPVPDSFPI